MDGAVGDDALYELSLQREPRSTESPSQAESLRKETLDRLSEFKVRFSVALS